MLDVISPEEEARLAALGCHVLLEPGDDAALIFDIGGGSTELVLIDTSEPVPRVLDWHSTPWGVVSLTEHIGEADSARARRAAYARMRSEEHTSELQSLMRISYAVFCLKKKKTTTKTKQHKIDVAKTAD